jgi:hypothetical protein
VSSNVVFLLICAVLSYAEKLCLVCRNENHRCGADYDAELKRFLESCIHLEELMECDEDN